MDKLQLDPALVEGYALRLERRAGSVRRGARLFGALVGAVLGAVPLTPLGDFLPVPETLGIATLVLGAAVGTLLGHVIGESRALDIRVQAQLVLCQLHGGQAPPEPRTPSIAPPQLLPVRRPVLEAVPAPSARRLEVVPPLSPTVS
jgi:hypothetical protein